MLLNDIVNKFLLNESVSINDVNDAINGHNRVIINYRADNAGEHSGPRIIEVYAYGLTKSGNLVIRAFQPYGDTTTKIPGWKLFRLDRIASWKLTNQTFDEPPISYYNSCGKFNQNGDNSMSIIYKVINFNNNTPSNNIT